MRLLGYSPPSLLLPNARFCPHMAQTFFWNESFSLTPVNLLLLNGSEPKGRDWTPCVVDLMGIVASKYKVLARSTHTFV